MREFEGTPVKLKRSNRKTLAIQVLADASNKVYLLIKAPQQIDEKQLIQIVKSKRSWIEDAKKKRLSLEESKKAMLSDYSIKDNGVLPFQGSVLNLKTQTDKMIPKLAVMMGSEGLYILKNPYYLDYQQELPALLKHYYMKKAHTVFSQMIETYSKQYGFRVNTLKIKDTKTRWGSCSAKMNINLNWRLIIAHERLYEYVIVHELCHLGCWHHGKQFWNRVASILPDYRVRKTELKEISDFLFAFDFSKIEISL